MFNEGLAFEGFALEGFADRAADFQGYPTSVNMLQAMVADVRQSLSSIPIRQDSFRNSRRRLRGTLSSAGVHARVDASRGKLKVDVDGSGEIDFSELLKLLRKYQPCSASVECF